MNAFLEGIASWAFLSVLVCSGVFCLGLFALRGDEGVPGCENSWRDMQRVLPWVMFWMCVACAGFALLTWCLMAGLGTPPEKNLKLPRVLVMALLTPSTLPLSRLALRLAERWHLRHPRREPLDPASWLEEDDAAQIRHAEKMKYKGRRFFVRPFLMFGVPIGLVWGALSLVRGETGWLGALAFPGFPLFMAFIGWWDDRDAKYLQRRVGKSKWQPGETHLRVHERSGSTRIPWKKIRRWGLAPCPGLPRYYVIRVGRCGIYPRDFILSEAQYPSAEIVRIFAERTGQAPTPLKPFDPNPNRPTT